MDPDKGGTTRRTVLGAAASFSCLLLLAVVLVAPAAAFEITSFGGSFTNSAGERLLQAGSHADVTTELDFALHTDDQGRELQDGQTKDVVVELPPGLAGNPAATPKCSTMQLQGPGGIPGFPECPPETQVGTATLGIHLAYTFGPKRLIAPGWPVYNVATPPGVAAQFAFNFLGVVVPINFKVKPFGDHALIAEVPNISQSEMVSYTKLTLWGVPGDPAHDAERAYEGGFTYGAMTSAPPLPLTSLPTQCSGQPLTTLVKADSWEEPGNFDAASFDHDLDGAPMETTGCTNLPFRPKVAASLTSQAAGSPTGLDLSIQMPQTYDNPNALSTPHLRDAVVTLPKGFAIGTSSADGLGACSDAQLGLESGQSDSCPDDSKIGSVEVTSPALEESLKGSVYLRTQASNDPASGQMFRLAMVISSKLRGILIKLPGEIKVDPSTGQIIASFEDNPQLPVSSVAVHLKGGDRAPLVTPSACGTYGAEVALTPWSSPVPVSNSVPLTINQNCSSMSQFTPGFQAGTTNPIGGSYSPFTLRVTRPDGQQNVSTIAATLPQGVLAKLAGVPLCGDANAATGNCPATSQVGSATVGTGAGSNPLYVPQPGKAPTAIYLAGPYKGAPYSLIAKVPAQAGPFDLGTVAVRNTISIDPTTAQVSVKSDPLPQILQGIPIAYRDIRVDVNRSDFTINPTSCDPMEVKGTIGSAAGTEAKVADRFQVASCERLSFKPNLKLSVKGPTHRNAFPALKAVLSMPKQNGANIQRAQVTLPKTELLEQAHIRTICTRVQYAAGAGGGAQCPPASIYGKAKAWSPLLDKPLEGPVYLRSSSHQLPDLVASLDGQIHIDLVGRIDAVNARIRNTFEGVPDAPVSRFVLEMQGGKKGLLANNTELCRSTPKAAVKFDAQNGKLADSSPVMKADCGGKKRKR